MKELHGKRSKGDGRRCVGANTGEGGSGPGLSTATVPKSSKGMINNTLSRMQTSKREVKMRGGLT